MAARKTTTKAKTRKAKDLAARTVGDRDARRVRGGEDSLKTFKVRDLYTEAVRLSINTTEAK